uniref:Uncharacterized protein n=1 Tax=Plectus sambesii TaxID=2011161 RepID=A0A914UTC7_9BILA
MTDWFELRQSNTLIPDPPPMPGEGTPASPHLRRTEFDSVMSATSGLIFVVVLVAVVLPVVQPMYYFVLPASNDDIDYNLYPELAVQKRASGSMNIPLSLRFGKRRYGLPVRFPHEEVAAESLSPTMTKSEWLRLMFGRSPVHGYESEKSQLRVPMYRV